MKKYQITGWCQHFIREHVQEGGLCIDATAGNGYDTLTLCEAVGANGKVIAFDIQKEAVERTKERLAEHQMLARAEVVLDSHTNMGQYAEAESVSCITFNLGYLPGGDHALATKKETSIRAVQEGLRLLKKGGMLSLCIYSGGDSGFEERDAVLAFLRALDPKKYLVIVSEYYNRPNHPPIPAMIIKM